MKVNTDLKVMAPSGDWMMVEPGDYPVRLRVSSAGVEQDPTPPSLSREQLEGQRILDFLHMEERLALLLQFDYPTISASIWQFIREMTKNDPSLPLHKTATHPNTGSRLNHIATTLHDESGGTYIIPSCSFKKQQTNIREYLRITGVDELVKDSEENKYDLGDSFYALMQPLQVSQSSVMAAIQERKNQIKKRAESYYQTMKDIMVSVCSYILFLRKSYIRINLRIIMQRPIFSVKFWWQRITKS
jgi:hypothetical protein